MTRRPWTLTTLLGAAGLLLLWLTRNRWPSYAPGCVFHSLTGLDCPGCGGTRCAMRLFRGDLPGAFRMNALVVIAGAAGLCWLGNTLWREWHGKPPVGMPLRVGWSLVAVVLAFWVLRNLPWAPFNQLAPH